MILGIEIGGTKLQLGVGHGKSADLVELVRLNIDRSAGAQGILAQVEEFGRTLIQKHNINRVGVGFGGPIEAESGVVLTSHQVKGWNNYPLVDWCREKLGIDAVIVNDCDAAALAESLYGAGVGASPVLYVTVGTGVGAGMVVDGQIYRGQGHGATEIGHLHTQFAGNGSPRTVESTSSGPAIAESMRRVLNSNSQSDQHVENPPQSNGTTSFGPQSNGAKTSQGVTPNRDEIAKLTAKDVGRYAREGNPQAIEIFRNAADTIGWGIAQAITLFAPACVVVGGGVSLAGEEIFVKPLFDAIHRNIVPAFRSSFDLTTAKLGEEMVVHGALTIAAQTRSSHPLMKSHLSFKSHTTKSSAGQLL